jgi:hypothetical protein
MRNVNEVAALFCERGDGWRVVAFNLPLEIFLQHVREADRRHRLVAREAGFLRRLHPAGRVEDGGVAPTMLVVSPRALDLAQHLAPPLDRAPGRECGPPGRQFASDVRQGSELPAFYGCRSGKCRTVRFCRSTPHRGQRRYRSRTRHRAVLVLARMMAKTANLLVYPAEIAKGV